MGFLGFGRPTADKIRAKGEQVQARIIGIEVSENSDGESSVRIDGYAVEVAAIPPFTAGVQQRLEPDDVVRLGMEITAHHLGGRIVLDWQESVGEGGDIVRWKPLNQPPASGIRDHTLGLDSASNKGVPATVTINRAVVKAARLGMLQTLHLDVTVRPEGIDPYTSELKKVEVPHYATHLPGAGVELPAWVRSNRLDLVTLDWATAATRHPGIGEPPAAILGEVGVVFTGIHNEWPAPETATDTGELESIHLEEYPEPVSGVDFDTWVAVQVGVMRERIRPDRHDMYAESLGVPPGTWNHVDAEWNRRIRNDRRLGAAYDEAIATARKQP